LYYPSHGYFLIPLLGKPVGHPGALAIPLTERLGIVAVPKDFDSERVRSFVSANGGALASKFSVGTNADRVVVHPSVMVDRDLAELGRQIVQMQKENLQVLQALSKIQELTLAAFAEVGIGPKEAMAWMAREQTG
jgi:hypothetical protein